MSVRRVTLAGLVTLGMLGGSLAFSGAAALAELGYGPSTQFGEPGSGNGQFLEPNGVAVDDIAGNPDDGDVYVLDRGNGRVEIFDASGKYLSEFNGSATPSGSLAESVGIAVDNSTSLSDPSAGDVYVLDAGGGFVDKFSASGEYLSAITGPEGRSFNNRSSETGPSLLGAVVDSNGNLWVQEEYGNRLAVDEFDSRGNPIISWGLGEYSSNWHNDNGIAVDSEDNVYVVVYYQGEKVEKVSSTGTDLGTVGSCGGCSITGLVFEPSRSYLFSDGETEIAVADSDGNPIEHFGYGNTSAGQGIAVNTTSGTVYVADLGSDAVSVFPLVVKPDVSVVAPSNVQRTSVTLNGTVDPDGIEANTIQFEYGLTAPYVTVAASPPVCPAVSATCPVSVNLTGLRPESTYHYRLDASNVNGDDDGQYVTYTTPPAVEGVSSGTATSLTASTATLTGSLAPNGLDAHYYFQYGLSASYGLSSPAPPEPDAGTTTGAVPATTMLRGLEPNTTYHFRLIASDSLGTTYGADETVTTPPAPPAIDGQFISGLTQRGAIIGASLDANNEDTTYHFEYGSTTAYGTNFPSADIGSGFGDVNVGQELTGLQAGTVYHFRVVASNATSPPGGTDGPDQTFTTPQATPPVLSTGAASGVTANAASLSGTVDPQGVATVYEFDIGSDTSYGTRVFGDAGSGLAPETVTVSLQGLAAGVTYHYRLAASNAFGTVYGADQTFTMPGFPSSLLTAPVAATLVSTAGLLSPSTTTVTSTPAAHPKKKTKRREQKKAKRKAKRTGGRKAGTAGPRPGERSSG